MADVRLIQLARLLGLPRSALQNTETTPLLVRDQASTLAVALFREAIASDDVVDVASALGYLDERLAFLAPYVDADAADVVLRYAREHAQGWETRQK